MTTAGRSSTSLGSQFSGVQVGGRSLGPDLLNGGRDRTRRRRLAPVASLHSLDVSRRRRQENLVGRLENLDRLVHLRHVGIQILRAPLEDQRPADTRETSRPQRRRQQPAIAYVEDVRAGAL